MEKTLIFLILSIPIVILSWKSLSRIKSHGFYRFFSFESILWLILSNYRYWFDDPLAVNQLFSWSFLFVALYLVLAGVWMMKIKGKQQKGRDEVLFAFEETTQLVDTGIFKYIRHPLYASLIFLTWGICLKNPTIETIVIATISTVFLHLTAIHDEQECLAYFGEKYGLYMKRTKRFIPFLF